MSWIRKWSGKEKGQVDLGCHPDTPAARQLGTNPGNYETNSTTVDVCMNMCSELAYEYAGLTHGKLCFCGNNLTSAMVSSSTCGQACTGNSGQLCGSDTVHLNVHQLTLLPMSSLTIDLPGRDCGMISMSPYCHVQSDHRPASLTIDLPAIIETYSSTSVVFNVTGGSDVTIAGSISDGSPGFSLPPSVSWLTHNLQSPGIAVIKATALDSNNKTGQTMIKGVTVSCPDVVTSTERFECFVTITMGTNMYIEADLGDGTIVPLNSTDCGSYTAGHSSGPVSIATHPGTGKLYLISGAEFHQNGSIVGFSYNAESAGTMTVQPLGERWKHRCGAGTIYSISQQSCVYQNSGQVVETTGNHVSGTFQFVAEISVSVASTGAGFYQVPDGSILTVQPGDFLALVENTAQLQIISAAVADYEYYYHVTSDTAWQGRATTGFTIEAAGNLLQAAHAIKAHVIRPVRIRFRHTYSAMNSAGFNVTVKTANNISAFAISRPIEVQVRILNVSISTHQTTVPTNETITLNVPAHPGSDVMYTWDFGDGVSIAVENASIGYTWSEAGVYNVTLYAANNISSVLTSLLVTIQDSIQNLTLGSQGPGIVIFTPSLYTWNITHGTNVSHVLNRNQCG
ncbi:uncharacterized protein LOC127869972 [Dreissena polymorpha]|uniref:uncharacterized protein LOC127869972 n=1 Tax=Dreissena polymorpha TaxID=45954 RepID=UPI0022646191|nr:uncharacterized protein LOC127869972 [Dreissena polymorpha]